MKTTGIVLVIIGIMSLLGSFIQASRGEHTSFPGLVFLVLGAFLISRANKNKEEEEKKKQWENNAPKKD